MSLLSRVEKIEDGDFETADWWSRLTALCLELPTRTLESFEDVEVLDAVVDSLCQSDPRWRRAISAVETNRVHPPAEILRALQAAGVTKFE